MYTKFILMYHKYTHPRTHTQTHIYTHYITYAHICTHRHRHTLHGNLNHSHVPWSLETFYDVTR